ncbi:MAG: type II secretion system protein [bacterium]
MIKKGFTLSEILVSLAILGVLAAFLIPALMKAVPNNNIVLFKKANYTLQQAVSEIINNDTNYPISVLGTTTDTFASVPRGFNYTTITGTIVPASNNKFCYLLSDQMNTVGTVSCPDLAVGGTGTFTTADGVSWRLIIPVPASEFPLTATDYTTRIVVDVNGTTKSPNCGTVTTTNISTACASGTIGDMYEMGVRYDGKLTVISAAGQTILLDPTKNTP